jgi:2-amino-4-hydroxy-6-hydroxymethyldihydropteridine diphosphokinase
MECDGALEKSKKYQFITERSVIWLGFGGNVRGTWGKPIQGFCRAIQALQRAGFAIVARSSLYETVPVGSVRQPKFLNAVVAIRGSVAPAALLRLLKQLERRAGRRATGRWGPRPLDIDILDFGGRITGGPASIRQAGRLVLPHPELARRGFVLVPLAEVAPQWHHPRLAIQAATLIKRRPALRRGVRRIGCWSYDPAFVREAAH